MTLISKKSAQYFGQTQVCVFVCVCGSAICPSGFVHGIFQWSAGNGLLGGGGRTLDLKVRGHSTAKWIHPRQHGICIHGDVRKLKLWSYSKHKVVP